MKKNFFKKLSFVMALAMTASVIAPAAGAFAAADPAISKTATRYLYLGTDKDEYDFNVANKVKGSTYTWSSDNEAVATVDAKGITTAVATGTANISVAIETKDGASFSSSVVVKVRDNIKELAIANPVAEGSTIAVGATYDFNRSYTTVSGLTKGTTSKTMWAVTDADGKATTAATIDAAGVFTATAAGTYTVTARAFQSAAKYTEWTTSAADALVLASATTTVTVAPSIVKVAQASTTTFQVTFDTDMSKSDLSTTTATLYKVVAGKNVNTGTEKLKSVAFDTTGKIATITLYTDFTQETAYSFVYGKLTGNFTTSKIDIDNVASIAFNDFSVDCTNGSGSADMLANIIAYDVNGVQIYTGTQINAISASYLTFTYGGENNKGAVSGTNAYLYAVGNTAKITVKFEKVVYDSTTKTYKTLSFTDDATATGTKTDSSITTSSLQFAAPLTTDTTAAASLTYSATGVTVAIGDNNKIATKYTKNNALTTTLYTTDTTVFTYKTTDSDKLVISGNVMYPVAAGKVTVIVYSGTTAVGAFDVTVLAARSFAAATIDNATLSVGNSTVDTTGATATVTITDSLGSAAKATAAVAVATNSPTGTTTANAPTVTTNIGTTGKVTVNVLGYNGSTASVVGVYYYKLTITSLTTTKDVYFTVNVVDATTSTAAVVSYYDIELGSTSLDVKGVTSSAITIALYGYNAAGVKIAKFSAADYKISVKNASGTEVSTDSSSIAVVTSASGTAVTSPIGGAGTYVVTATASGSAFTAAANGGRAAGAYLDSASLAVSDTTTKSVTVDSTAVTYVATSCDSAYEVAKAALTFVLNATNQDDSGIVSVKYTKGSTGLTTTDDTVAAGDSVYIDTVTYKVVSGTTYFEYTADVKKSITVK
jgi:hypothetical protein